MPENLQTDTEMDAAQATELAQLQLEVAQADGVPSQEEAQAQESQEQESQEQKLAAEICGYILAAVEIGKKAFPSLEEIYTPQTAMTAGSAVAAICRKYNICQGGIGGEYAVEIGAAVVLIPLAYSTYIGVQADIAARTRQQVERSKPGQIPGEQGSKFVAGSQPANDEAQADSSPPGVTVGQVQAA